MRYRATIIIILIFCCFTTGKAQDNIEGVKIITEVKKETKTKNNNEIAYGKIEVFIKDKSTKKNVPVYVLEIGKVASFVSNAEGYSKFLVRPGKYNIVVKMIGYNEKRIKKLKVTSKSSYKIEIELDPMTQMN